MNVWKGIRKQPVSIDILEMETVPGLISYCLQRLDGCSAGTAMYILSCLCPDDFDLVLALIRLDLSCPHQHKWLSEKNRPLKSNSCEDLLALLRIRTSNIPMKEYSHFWLELTKGWLLTCTVDLEYYRTDETGEDLFCQKLRSELVERILRID